MENASKALIIAGSVLITVMLMSFMIFMFRRFKTIAKDTETNLSELEIQAFNAKFVNYETGGTHSLTDKIGVTLNRGRTVGTTTLSDPVTESYQYSRVFNGSISNKDYYYKALVATSQTLNTAADVVTAINDAIDTNYNNSNGYLYNYVEEQTSVEIIVDLNGMQTSFTNSPIKNYRYLIIEPNKEVKSKKVYGFASGSVDFSVDGNNTSKRLSRINSLKTQFTDTNAINAYDILENMRDTEHINNDGKDYIVYKYYFFGQVLKNSKTHLVETVKFTLVKDAKFGNRE